MPASEGSLLLPRHQHGSICPCRWNKSFHISQCLRSPSGSLCLVLPFCPLPPGPPSSLYQVKAGRELPGLQPEKSRSTLSMVESCQGQTEVRRPSPGKPPWPLCAASLEFSKGRRQGHGTNEQTWVPALRFPSQVPDMPFYGIVFSSVTNQVYSLCFFKLDSLSPLFPEFS